MVRYEVNRKRVKLCVYLLYKHRYRDIVVTVRVRGKILSE